MQHLYSFQALESSAASRDTRGQYINVDSLDRRSSASSSATGSEGTGRVGGNRTEVKPSKAEDDSAGYLEVRITTH